MPATPTSRGGARFALGPIIALVTQPLSHNTSYVPAGVGTVKPTGAPNKGFGGAARGLLEDDEKAEVAELRAMLGKA